MTRKAQMFITGPQVIKQVTGEQITAEELGGADAHMMHSGVIHFIAEDDVEAVEICKRLLSFLPSNNLEEPPRLPHNNDVDPNPELNKIVPVEVKRGYDMRDVICGIVDQADFLEVQAGYAPNMLVGFARILGRSIGIIANQPAVLSGAIDINASIKSSRFIRFCNAFNIPLVTFVDVPGFMPGVQQEHGGIIRNGAKMLFAYSAATVPKIQIVLRKSYGGPHIWRCARRTWGPIAFLPGQPPRSPSWGPKAPSRSSSARRWRQPTTSRASRRADRAVPLDLLDPLRRGWPPPGR